MGCGRWCGLGLLPVALMVTLSCSFLTTFIIAWKEGHIDPAFPYISDTGADPPESCVFTLMLSLCSFLVFCIVFVRYKQVAEYNKQDVLRVLRLNRWGSYVGYLAAFGMLVVASFQEIYVGVVHLTGATMTFAGGVVYGIMQCVMTYRMQAGQTTMQRGRLLLVRMVINLLTAICFVNTMVFMAVSHKQFHVENNYHLNASMHWKKGDGGYEAHIASTVSEWAMGFLFAIFFLTFFKEFQRINLDVHIRLRLHEDFSFGVDRQPLNEGIARLDEENNHGDDGVW
ncbi:DNA damage-regulated autophagy modulator protein 2-like [Sycon ciliatum]|uniref:DNA damage-regulated autophagy modulator protein 2-like n=1 Tax=Sycon ciliatum TaxID=27933 RepID=UPI0020AD8AF6|eukprot:scpid77941/ scgid8289/ DNA damage-regulated autophagy modulator protein 2; Transmembrane protein 77